MHMKKMHGKSVAAGAAIVVAAGIILLCFIAPVFVKADGTDNEGRETVQQQLNEGWMQDTVAFMESEIQSVLREYRMEYKKRIPLEKSVSEADLKELENYFGTDRLKDIMLDVIYELQLDDESVDYICREVLASIRGYVQNMEYGNLDRASLKSAIKQAVYDCISKNRDNISFIAVPQSRSEDIINQIAEYLGIVEKDIIDEAYRKISVELLRQIISGNEVLTDDVINAIAEWVTDSVTENFENATKKYNEQAELIKKQMESLNEEYKNTHNSIEDIQKQIKEITDKKTAGNNINTEELKTLERRLSEAQKNLEAIDNELNSMKETQKKLSLLSADFDASKKELTASVNSVREELISFIDSVKNSGDNYDEEFDDVYSVIDELTDICNKLEDDSLTVSEFAKYSEAVRARLDSFENMIGSSSEDAFDGINSLRDNLRLADEKMEKYNNEFNSSLNNLESRMGGFDASLGEMEGSLSASIEALQAQINELKKSVSDGKASVASAITECGVTTEADAVVFPFCHRIHSLSVFNIFFLKNKVGI